VRFSKRKTLYSTRLIEGYNFGEKIVNQNIYNPSLKKKEYYEPKDRILLSLNTKSFIAKRRMAFPKPDVGRKNIFGGTEKYSISLSSREDSIPFIKAG
jgi:hypothetical protein